MSNIIHSCPWSHGLRKKKLLVSVAVAPAPVRVPSQRPRAPIGQLGRSLMIRVIMKWFWGCAQISWYLPYSWGKHQKTSTRIPSEEEAVLPVIVSNGVPFLQMRSVGWHSTSGREKEGNKEGMGSGAFNTFHQQDLLTPRVFLCRLSFHCIIFSPYWYL